MSNKRSVPSAKPYGSSTFRQRRVHSKRPHSVNSIARAVSNLTSPTGTITTNDDTTRISWVTSAQGYSQADQVIDNVPVVNCQSDILTVVADALIHTIDYATSATSIIQPRFWIKRASVQCCITNAHQYDCDVTFYPWVARYDNSRYDIFGEASLNALDTDANGVNGTPITIGWTPFQSPAATQMFKFGKPKKVHLQGGQSYTYTVRDNKPLFVNWGRFGSVSNQPETAPGLSGFSGRTRGCVFTARGMTVNDNTTPGLIAFSAGAINMQLVKRYEWIAAAQPCKFSDVVTNGDAVTTVHIVQPQTGVINTTPTAV